MATDVAPHAVHVRSVPPARTPLRVSSPPAEWPVLAGVRFLLALAVANYHLFVVRAEGRVPVLNELGSMGCICGFLVISGYSIAHSISTKPRGFYRRRAWRILPIYYVTMILSLLPYLWAKGPPDFRFGVAAPDQSEVVGSTFLLQCFVTEKIPIFGPSWTLAIEWWFYALAPLLVRARFWMLATLIAISLAGQHYGLAHFGYPIHQHRYGIPALMLLWAWVSGFLFYRYRANAWSATILVVVGYVAVGRFPEDGSYLPYLVASFAVLEAKALPRIPAPLARALNYLGDLSYPLYLVHVPLMMWSSRYTSSVNPYFFLALALSCSALLYHGVDAPLRAHFSSARR